MGAGAAVAEAVRAGDGAVDRHGPGREAGRARARVRRPRAACRLHQHQGGGRADAGQGRHGDGGPLAL
ncbi:unnamed protein product, partial [Heterosigma akashiwo]